MVEQGSLSPEAKKRIKMQVGHTSQSVKDKVENKLTETAEALGKAGFCSMLEVLVDKDGNLKKFNDNSREILRRTIN